MEKLSQILWRERELLDTLQFSLEQERMMLASGRTRWLMRSARQVENVLTTLRETEILRSIAADQVAASIGLAPNPTLLMLAEACVEPWRTILADHHEAFVAATQEVGVLADANRELIPAGVTALHADQQLQQTSYRASMAATARVMQPSLLEFLR